jgi:hypothetical protein
MTEASRISGLGRDDVIIFADIRPLKGVSSCPNSTYSIHTKEFCASWEEAGDVKDCLCTPYSWSQEVQGRSAKNVVA